ncbi:MAG TPA: hypothetical protein PLP39_02195 [Flavobacterium lutivivi]|nr:hypothetical protein [Flavobacterium lutivivi]
MKKLCVYCLFFLVIIVSSCSSDSSSTTDEPNPNLLQRVDFYSGTSFETRWIFNTDGLLSQINKADGTIVQDFIYDDQNRLTSSTKYNSPSPNQVYTFTYDANGFVATVNGVTVNYDSTLDAYYTGILNQNYRLTKINNEKLITNAKTVFVEIEDGETIETEWYLINVNYLNNNITSYFPDESCNYLTHDEKINPLRNATLAICRAFSFIENSPWINGYYNSANNVLSHSHCLEDPESYQFHYTYNVNNMPITQTRDDYYLGEYESTISSANYYYQGDTLP